MVFVCLVKQASWGLKSASENNSESSVDKLYLIYIKILNLKDYLTKFSYYQILSNIGTSWCTETFEIHFWNSQPEPRKARFAHLKAQSAEKLSITKIEHSKNLSSVTLVTNRLDVLPFLLE